MEGAEGLLAAGTAVLLIGFAIIIGLYIVIAIFLNKFNKLVYGKGTALAWIPICNTYLLGKLTVNKIVGWILVACNILTTTITTTDANGVQKVLGILPESIRSVISSVYGLALLGLFIYAIVKYNQLKKSKQQQN